MACKFVERTEVKKPGIAGSPTLDSDLCDPHNQRAALPKPRGSLPDAPQKGDKEQPRTPPGGPASCCMAPASSTRDSARDLLRFFGTRGSASRRPTGERSQTRGCVPEQHRSPSLSLWSGRAEVRQPSAAWTDTAAWPRGRHTTEWPSLQLTIASREHLDRRPVGPPRGDRRPRWTDLMSGEIDPLLPPNNNSTLVETSFSSKRSSRGR